MRITKIITTYIYFFSVITYAQLGIGTTAPNSSAQLDIVSANKGLLIPRVALQDTKDNVTIADGNIVSLLVYNTSNVADIVPGFYYWNGTAWQRLSNGGGSSSSGGTETLTSLEMQTNDNDTPGDNTDDFPELIYIDENNDQNIITLSDIAHTQEKITSLRRRINNNGTPGDNTDDFQELIYINENDDENLVDLDEVVIQILTKLGFSITVP